MAYEIEGDYFEACNCEASCPCIMLSPATEDTCDLVFGWHVASGHKDGVSLAGLNVALAVRSPKQMTDGGWTAALYLDERADPAQTEALQTIFSGQAGGHLANVAPLIGTVTGVQSAPIVFEKRDGVRTLRVADLMEAEVEELRGMDGERPVTIDNPLFSALVQPVRQGRSKKLWYEGAFSFQTSARNSFIAEFRYEAA
ncbi:MAG TPA: DUF1326 domain-containing protein [Actinomycetota bacterium]